MTPPLTLNQVIDRLVDLREEHGEEEVGELPVFLKVMDLEGDGLVTDVELLTFQPHGTVPTLISWRMP